MTSTKMLNLEDYKLTQLPFESVYYIPDFINKEEEQKLLEQVERAPKTKWVHLSNRSLQQYGGVPRPEGMIAEPMPAWLQPWINRLNEMNVFDGKKANHVLMNRYEPGQGIMPHTDGPMYHPVVTTINTGESTVLNFYRKTADNDGGGDTKIRQYVFSLLLQPRSLLVLKNELYTNFEHSIDELLIDRVHPIHYPIVINLNDPMHESSSMADPSAYRQFDVIERKKTRYSFTIRHVPKVIHSRLANWILNK